MITLPELFKRDKIRAAWFWVDSINTGPYAEQEKFDLVFTRQTGQIVGGGEFQRTTLYVPGILTAESRSRRNNGNRVLKGDDMAVLYNLLCDALHIDNEPTFPRWVEETRDPSAFTMRDYEDWQYDTAMTARMHAWLGAAYDEYTRAAAEYEG